MKLSNNIKHKLKQQYGPYALVTGGTMGIGLEISERLAESGINLILNARNSERLNKVADELESTYSIHVKTIAADLSDHEGIRTVINFSKQYDIGLFVAAAGFGTSGIFAESDLENETNMLHVNIEAVLKMTYHFANKFKQREKSGIILFSSLVAFQGVPYSANYAATKAYIQTFAEGIAKELKPFGINVLVAAPGPVKSGFGERANMKMDMALSPEKVGIPVLKALGRKTTVVPGALSKLLVYSLKTVPRTVKTSIMQKVMSGMTQHQRN
jgi:short-subunit dehydrogenase